MATSQMSEFVQQLRRMMVQRDGAGLTDGQLLENYLSRHDEAALAALVHRHGPMVWGVCRRVLSNYHDAEDAFQATFLVLVRKAASIASRELLANWLYGVAHQTALKARATAAKIRARETQVTEMPKPTIKNEDLMRDLKGLLDEELSRLPDKYRAVIVLCDLEGKTRKQAARQLGCPEGTVAGRLARARIMLAKRLTQRGVALSGGASAAVLAQQGVSAGVPNSVVSSAIKAASLYAAGKVATGAISIKVATLTEGVVKAMSMSKLKAAFVLMVFACVLGSAGGAVVYQTHAEAQQIKDVSTEQAKEIRGLQRSDIKRVAFADDTLGEKLRKAFPGGEVERSPIRLYFQSKRLLIAADRMEFETDGKVKLTGCAIALFQAPKDSDEASRPTTIRSKFARIKLDRPMHSVDGLPHRKIDSVELSGGVRLTFEE